MMIIGIKINPIVCIWLEFMMFSEIKIDTNKPIIFLLFTYSLMTCFNIYNKMSHLLWPFFKIWMPQTRWFKKQTHFLF